MTEKIDYFIASLDFHLSLEKPPAEALAAAVEDYAVVFHTDNTVSSISKATRVAMQRITEIADYTVGLARKPIK